MVGLPVFTIALGELSERLQARANPLAQGLQQLRLAALPMLVLLLLMRQVLGWSASTGAMRLLESLFGFTVIYVGLTFLSNLTRLSQQRSTAWLAQAPRLFLTLSRALLVLMIGYYVLSSIWQVDVSSLFTAVGIGALAISFALQDTLSNLVSGFLLLVDQPFRPGDYVEIEDRDYFLIVEEVNWRAVRFRAEPTYAIEVIPNGALGSAAIRNFGQRGAPYRILYFLPFAYTDPPNRVKKLLLEVLQQEEGVLPA